MKWVYLFKIMSLFLLSAFSCVQAEEVSLNEEAVKAAFTYNFAKFVVWPDDKSRNTVNLCLIGDDLFDDAVIATIDGHPVHSRKLKVIRLLSLSNISQCQVLFITDGNENALSNILNQAHQYHILTVSDLENFALQDGIIGLLLIDGKIRFQINKALAEQAGLQISSQLLNLAETVFEQTGHDAL